MQNRLMQWSFETPNAAAFTNPLMQGVEAAYRDRQQAVENERANRMMALQEGQFGLQKSRFGMDQQRFTREEGERAQTFPLELQGKRANIAQAEAATATSNAQRAQYQNLPPAERMRIAPTLGFKEGTPEHRDFIINGKAPTAGDAPASVREWQAFSMLPKADQERYLTMKRSDKYLDTGTGYVRPSQVDPTAPPVAVVDKNNAEEARQKVVGREVGELQMGMPKAQVALESAESKADRVVGVIADARKLVSPFTTGMSGAILSRLPGTTARDLAAKIDTLKANAGFEELQSMRDNSPTGGALGGIAVQELAMLQSTITSLEQAQTVGQFRSALDAYEKFVTGSKERRRRAFEATYGPSRTMPGPMGSRPQAQQPAPQPQGGAVAPGQYVYDPASGRLVPKGGN